MHNVVRSRELTEEGVYQDFRRGIEYHTEVDARGACVFISAHPYSENEKARWEGCQ
jgi:hypothetical protein